MKSCSKQIIWRCLAVCIFFSCPPDVSGQTGSPGIPGWKRPAVERRLYRATVDGKFLWKKYHLSGLLLLKTMPDSSVRAVFSNEMGFPFFDFSWDSTGSFTKHSIMQKMDRKSVVNLLRKDFEMLFQSAASCSGGHVAAREWHKRSFFFYLIPSFLRRTGADAPYGYVVKTYLSMICNGNDLPPRARIENYNAGLSLLIQEISTAHAE